ncbi:hypothetical protein ETD86_01735 [Nonomuraea turkmeniaca]|uniref:Orc1-like AAA ATPase domain-containing protein n=1 Tax=Nonomuraea turkmeniaca TaxID=103838 RepID=A0A5S4FYI8_9ACTN|nr:ATP-binding protein [Nonomuraea turkmeniaca]TMR25334.1 hypothetical protein ETD86_01735 [Nonomuraea turkmeniaca]
MAMLIGRDRPAAVLRGEIERTLVSHGSLVLVTGEAGIGKSTLVASAAQEAVHGGARLLSGSCWSACPYACRAPEPPPSASTARSGPWPSPAAPCTCPTPRGLADLRILLERLGVDVSAVELLNPSGGEVVVAAGRLGGDDVLDEEARTRYRKRLEQLGRRDRPCRRARPRSTRGRARRAAELDAERQALLGELRAAAGLGGRPRRLGDEAERARKAVTDRIRNALRQLDQRHPELAAHLRASVSTGATCSYRPPPAAPAPRWA